MSTTTTLEIETRISSSFRGRQKGEEPTPAHKISALFFDLDNTIIKTREADLLACQKIAKILVRDYNVPHLIASHATETFLSIYRKCPAKEELTLEEWRSQLWSQALGEEYAKFAGAIYTIWKQIRLDCLYPSESTLNLLRTLKKRYRMAMITNGISSAQWEKIEEMKLEAYFDAVIVSGDCEWEKPAPEIFHNVCNILGVEPFECLMVGDRIESDVKGGFQAELGIMVWIPKSGCTLETSYTPPDFTIHDICQLETILQPENDFLKVKHSRRPSKETFEDTSDISNDSNSSFQMETSSGLSDSSLSSPVRLEKDCYMEE